MGSSKVERAFESASQRRVPLLASLLGKKVGLVFLAEQHKGGQQWGREKMNKTARQPARSSSGGGGGGAMPPRKHRARGRLKLGRGE